MATTKNSKQVDSAGWKKVTARKINLSKEKPGFSLEGKFMGLSTSEPVMVADAKTGEIYEKKFTSVIFEDENGERFGGLADKGLQSALRDANIEPGQYIRIEKLPKAELSRGRTMNQWDVFVSAR